MRARLAATSLVAAAVALAIAAFAVPSDGGRDDPPPRRPVAAQALAAEQVNASDHGTRRPVLVDRRAARPEKLVIRAIGVAAPIVPLGLRADKTMQTPRRFTDTGWFQPGPEPGERGPAVIAGHVDSFDGPAVFARLQDLHPGDLIRVLRADGSGVRFRVEGLERRPKARFPTRRVFGPTRAATLRLVTCSGAFDASTGHYLDNTIVYAVRVRAGAARRD